MRSFAELSFRARQEAANLFLLYKRPGFKGRIDSALALPNGKQVAEGLRSSSFATEVEKIADQIVVHEFSILGLKITTGPEIRWRKDYLHGKESGLPYFKRVPYLNFEVVGDHKLVWELNRHQHLVLLAQAYLLNGRRAYCDEVWAQIRSWLEQNPFQRGMNWASALEVAFRTLSWIWVLHLIGHEMPEQLRTPFLTSLYQHGRHLADNLSVYFSPNTHLLGEAVALFVLGTLIPDFPESKAWVTESRAIVLKQLAFQVWPDGAHFEQSSYYHVYAADFFLLFYLANGRDHETGNVLERMAEYLYWLLGTAREISFFGDDDGGRLFHPYGVRSRFGRATLATCGILLGRKEWIGTCDELAEQAAWWVGPEALECAVERPSVPSGGRSFKDSGAVFLEAGEFWLQMDCGPFGYGGAGHSHSDTLSLTLRYAGEPVLVDPGTFTYIADIEERNWFRGSIAHSSVRVGGKDQAVGAGPFRWTDKPIATLSELKQKGAGWYVNASCEYRGLTHRRRLWLDPEQLLVLDEITGWPGEHLCEQIWQLGEGARGLHISTSTADSKVERSRFSPAYGSKVEGQCLVATMASTLPIRAAMRLSVEDRGPITAVIAEELLSRLLEEETKL